MARTHRNSETVSVATNVFDSVLVCNGGAGLPYWAAAFAQDHVGKLRILRQNHFGIAIDGNRDVQFYVAVRMAPCRGYSAAYGVDRRARPTQVFDHLRRDPDMTKAFAAFTHVDSA